MNLKKTFLFLYFYIISNNFKSNLTLMGPTETQVYRREAQRHLATILKIVRERLFTFSTIEAYENLKNIYILGYL